MKPEEDFRRRFVEEAWEYIRTKARFAPREELEALLAELLWVLRARLRELPVVRIWPDQWLKFPPS